MGLSSSQARLLNLTTRMHQIEYKAAKLEAMKLQMANESTRVYEDYLNALEKTKVQVKTLTTDGAVTYNDISSYESFLSAGYAIDFNNKVYDGQTHYIGDNGVEYFPATAPAATPAETPAEEPGTTGPVSGAGEETPEETPAETPAETPTVVSGDYVDARGNAVPEGVTISEVVLDWAQLCEDAFGATTTEGLDVETVITNLINSGMVTIVTPRANNIFAQEVDKDFEHYETSIATNTGLQEVTDGVELKKAEAKYEADMKRIDMKDRRYDQDLAALDNERNAIKQEMETLKTVAKDNVERTFKLFG